MRERMTNPPEPGTGGEQPSARDNNTRMEQGENQHEVPRMPYERDESVDSQPEQEPSMRRVAKAGQADAEHGVTDTSKGAELDATYDKLREDLPDGEKTFRP
ncbi:MAG TPA: hypothetical protein VFE82_02020 [Ramlibacter sp.]|jgi:hypothetical protein|uniref:hypothetical protein n=1 Tax=Ramlibacter sp. TaxID=1917967 RepID=UPI002D45F84D|nr:hypothetical protein [Ramlibacter sp.]HZY17223.1 hypothetical protein [Ramlibacter sp.]